MAVTYTNRKNKTYYLHQGKTKTGKTKYHFSLKDQGNLVDRIPDGYEIYEHPSNGQVFLRHKVPKFISEIEESCIKKNLQKLNTTRPYKVDIRKKIITIFECDIDIEEIREKLSGFSIAGSLITDRKMESELQTTISSSAQFTPVLRFILTDETTRSFIAERFCFRGGIDDWIYIGGPDTLDKLAQRFIKELGRESFFEIFGFRVF